MTHAIDLRTIDYPPVYHRELEPARLNYVAALAGFEYVDLTRPFTYLELGCGAGSSLMRHAQRYPHAEFIGCDANVAQVRAAPRLPNAVLHPCAFDAFDVSGPFDFIVMHGVYSWVAPEVRETLRRIVAANLADPGFVYVSYNTVPGWRAVEPYRKMVFEVARRYGFVAIEPFLRGLPAEEGRDVVLGDLERKPAGYFAHEYCNADWEALYSADVMADFAALGLRYLGSATLADNHPELAVDAATRDRVRSAPEALRELLLDVALERGFRRDVFGTPSRDPSAIDRIAVEGLDGNLAKMRRVSVPRGFVEFSPNFVAAVERLLATGPLPFGELVGGLGGGAAVRRNLNYLVAGGGLVLG